MTTWLDKGRCSSCKHCGTDMDMEPYCAHPKVKAGTQALDEGRKFPWGLNINTAIEFFCGQDLKLREDRA
jgi:hypothetical protein